jgi:hypothetical protein
MFRLVDQVTTPQGHVAVTTRTRFYFFFTRPNTSIMPVERSTSGGQPGFQVVYNTSDPIILTELHRFWVDRVSGSDFQSLMVAAKNGFLRLPPELEHLKEHIIGFRC